MFPNSHDGLAEKNICRRCVGDDFLREEIERAGGDACCDYCDESGEKTWTIGELAVYVERAFEEHYERTSTEPEPWEYALLADREELYEWERRGVEVVYAIGDAAQIPEDAARDVQQLLEDSYFDREAECLGEETGFASDAHYDLKGVDATDWHWEWGAFERALQTEARFFSRTGAKLLDNIFTGIDGLLTRGGHPPVTMAGPGLQLDHLYRARVFQSEKNLLEALRRPDLHLGPPPAKLASAGRMNARGISVFYGATAKATATAEVRPPVGSSVAVARFDFTRPLRLLDLTSLATVWDQGSVFDPTLKRRLERVAFLRTLGEKMTRPVMPDDEAFDYLATQAIADFLASEDEPKFDGIVFPSVQVSDGCNVVLFHKASKVAELDLSKDTKIESYPYLGYDEEVNYHVSEVVPQSSAGSSDIESNLMELRTDSADDHEDAALQIDPHSVEVHRVKEVKYECDVSKVVRRRSEAREEEF
ncbi:RES family NAD+ phosphorylase [Laribacter hongkongensis]|uniref:RES family NAD+ phosphorylase n=1 Tax=Laribacter hongkongensis TaxID=168471 RepID=UPI001EFE705D|nr:RES family NAD+ phosphorylase [Laribacter hongkongensis]MCG8995077.1 RES family NAD+ phosphorylase [Laribacter hongkongensis]MCG9011188.1 RES family NAD+ phosphorylase [Laribacter hongkongensis]MCG9023587.1 RES family NAD+ phosphorylase [Laribacter hongkongensis]MCG9047182.1 RES family NAD+ phosphorylase [Laribacter hongkongensis]MCG9074620.1 RES family NAD+ phosphorylase [Laribacter hongkongensis]